MNISNIIKKNRYVIIGVIFMCIIAVTVFKLPENYFFYYDRRTQNGTEYLNTDVNIYQVEYNTFAEKLTALGELYFEDAELWSVLIQSVNDDEYLSDISNAFEQEINIWKNWGLIPDYITYDYDADNLKSCGLYSLYAEGEDDNIKTFNYWKLEFENEDGVTYTAALDAEFQKIYEIKIACISEKQNQTFIDNMQMSTGVEYYNAMSDVWCSGIKDYFGFDSSFYVEYFEKFEDEFFTTLICNETNLNFSLIIGVENYADDIYIGIFPTDNFLQL